MCAKLFVVGSFLLFLSSAFAVDTLDWVGVAGAKWDAVSATWKKDGSAASAWMPGSIAAFGANGSAVVTQTVEQVTSGLMFSGDAEKRVTVVRDDISYADFTYSPTADIQLFGGGNLGLSVQSPDGVAPGAIKVTGGKVTIDEDVSDLTFDADAGCVSGTREIAKTDWVMNDNTVAKDSTQYGTLIWKNRTLANIKGIRAVFGHFKPVGGQLVFHHETAATCHYRCDPSGTWAVLDCQSPSYVTAGDTMPFHRALATFRFTQVGSDIYLKRVGECRRYYHQTTQTAKNFKEEFPLYRFDKWQDPAKTWDDNTFATQQTWKSLDWNYGLRNIQAGEVTTTGGKGLVADMGEESAPSGILARDAADPVLFWRNAKLTDIDYLFANIRRDSDTEKTKEPARGYNLEFSESDTKLTVDFETYRSELVANEPRLFVVCVRVAFTQVGNDIYARWLTASEGEVYQAQPCTVPCTFPADAPVKEWTISECYPVYRSKLVINGNLRHAGPLVVTNGTLTVGSASYAVRTPTEGAGSIRYVRDLANLPHQGHTVWAFPQDQEHRATYRGATIFGAGAHYLVGGSQVVPAGGNMIFEANAQVVHKGKAGIESANGENLPYGVYLAGEVYTPPGESKVDNRQKHLIYIGKDAQYEVTSQWMSDHRDWMVVDGGSMNMQLANHRDLLFLKNGGKYLGIGGTLHVDTSLGRRAAAIISDGDNPTNENLLTLDDTTRTFKFYRNAGTTNDVVLVTKANFALGTVLVETESGAASPNVIRKIGPARLRFSSTVANNMKLTDGVPKNVNKSRLMISQGVFRNESSRFFQMEYNPLTLEDQTKMEIAAGVAQSNADLTVVGTTQIDFGNANTRLVLPSADKLILDAATKLKLTGDLGAQGFRVGMTKVLTRSDLAKVKIVDGDKETDVVQDDEGYIVPHVPTGLILVVR